jgi:hypothetical protein
MAINTNFVISFRSYAKASLDILLVTVLIEVKLEFI